MADLQLSLNKHGQKMAIVMEYY